MITNTQKKDIQDGKKELRKIYHTLLIINDKTIKTGFFNIAIFINRYGLVYGCKRWGLNAVGNKTQIGTDYHLTDKGKQYFKTLEAII